MERTMKNELVITAATVDAAIEDAIEQLGVQREDVEVEVIEEPVKRLFGGVTEAKVRVSLLTQPASDDVDGEGVAGEQEDTTGGSPGRGADDGEDGAGEVDEAGDEDGAGDEEADEAGDGAETDSGAEADDEEADDIEGTGAAFSEDQEKNFNEVSVQLTDDELDTIADTAIEAVQNFLSYFGVEDASIDEYEGEEGELILDIIGDNLAVIIGRHGKTLDSLQFLVSAIVGKKTGYRHPIIVDVEGYKHRRKQKLVSIAKSSAARVIRQKREVNLRPMSPYERRIIHVALKDDKRVVTSSEGTEPGRYVVIRLA
jgi:spoIIIJ-associated protein